MRHAFHATRSLVPAAALCSPAAAQDRPRVWLGLGAGVIDRQHRTLEWDSALSDEEWVDWSALDDNALDDRVKADFGMDAP